jgi:hypothetical protein
MRALWSVVVAVCLVAASGVAPGDARAELAASALAPGPTSGVLAARPAVHAVTGRARTPDLGEPHWLWLPPVALAAGFALPPPPRRALALPSAGCDRVVATLLLTRSARGPPIA